MAIIVLRIKNVPACKRIEHDLGNLVDRKSGKELLEGRDLTLVVGRERKHATQQLSVFVDVLVGRQNDSYEFEALVSVKVIETHCLLKMEILLFK
jgi:hypothetical protein